MPEKRKSAFMRATQEAQKQEESEPVAPLRGDAAILSESITVKRQSGSTAKKEEKVTFYLTTEQVDKLDELVYAHKKQAGKRVNRNEIVRYLIDQCTIDSIVEM